MASDRSAEIAQCIASGSGVPADEGLALAVAVFVFVGAAMWVVHRFGGRTGTGTVPGSQPVASPALAPAMS